VKENVIERDRERGRVRERKDKESGRLVWKIGFAVERFCRHYDYFNPTFLQQKRRYFFTFLEIIF